MAAGPISRPADSAVPAQRSSRREIGLLMVECGPGAGPKWVGISVLAAAGANVARGDWLIFRPETAWRAWTPEGRKNVPVPSVPIDAILPHATDAAKLFGVHSRYCIGQDRCRGAAKCE